MTHRSSLLPAVVLAVDLCAVQCGGLTASTASSPGAGDAGDVDAQPGPGDVESLDASTGLAAPPVPTASHESAPPDAVGNANAPIALEYGDAGAFTCSRGDVASAVCGSLCGNGVRDACPLGTDGGVAQEECDGTDLGGASCVSLGFAGGNLRCGVTCNLDTSACQTCSPTAYDASGCPALAPLALDVAASASDKELGFAWVEDDSACNGVRFDRYSPDLARLSESACLGSCDALRVAVAPTPSGWLLAISTGHGLDLLPLDKAGTPTGALQTITNVLRPLDSSAVPALVPRGAGGATGGGPLLVVGLGSDWVAALLSDDGSEEQPVVDLGVGFGFGSAVFSGDGFLVAGDPLSQVAVRRLGLDGSVGSEHPPSTGDETLNPQLAWTGSEALVTFSAPAFPENGLFWARLDANGLPIDSPHFIGPRDDLGLLTTLTGEMVLLSHDGPSVSQLGTLRIPEDGGAPSSLAPVGFAMGYADRAQLFAQGTAIFATWLTQAAPSSHAIVVGGRAVLARVQ